MAEPLNISTIDRPYDAHLFRSASSDVATESVSSTDTEANNGSDSGSQTNNSQSSSNGNVESQPVRSEGALGDIWVNTFIRSTNWKPRTQGFTIEGQNGYAEFCNVFVSGNIQALTGLIGGFTIGATSISASSGGNTTIISSGSTAFSAGPTGFPTVTITQAGVLTASGAVISGTLTATLGFIGGWTIAATSISDTSGLTGMSSAVTLGDDVRFWAGHVTPGSAPFRVTESGALVASSATITGAITSTSGAIGGWVVDATSIKDVAGTVGLSSAVTAGDDIRFFAGSATPASAPFRVTEAGVVTATSGTIGGWTLATSTLTGTGVTLSSSSDAYISFGVTQPALPTVGTGIFINKTGLYGLNANVQNFIIDATNGYITANAGTVGGCTLATTSIGSTTFVSGPLGSGWNISNTGSAEFQNVSIRGVIKSTVFQKDTVSAVNGMVMISKSDILSADMTALDASTLVISGQSSFVNNEVIRIKDGTDDEYMLVTDASGAPTYVVTRDLAGSYGANANPIWKKGTAIVSFGVGTGTKTGYISLDSSSANSPYIDIYGRNSNTYTDTSLHVRLGWLKGLTDADVGLATTDVWGLYTDNAYIKGTVVANLGYIGGTTGWTIAAGYIKKDTGVELTSAGMAPLDYPFYAGAQYANRATAPFNVTSAGILSATGATISGALTATTGAIGGWIITAGYIKDVAAVTGLSSVVTAGDDIRIWAGHATPGSAPFYVTESGALVASSATITGVITANTGYIGGATGWVISTNYIKDVAGVTGMSSVVTAGDDIRFWAGNATPGSAPFYVTEAGALFASSATITGVVTADTGKIGGAAAGWTIAATKIYGGSGSAFSGLIQGTGTTKSFFAGATDNAGTDAKFYVTAAGDLVATSATISGYKLFEAIVAPTGGDYTTVSAALLAGKTRIFVRNGTYSAEPRWAITTAGTTIVGESKAGVIISFAKDTTQTDITSGACKSISIPVGKNNCAFNSLTLNSYDFTGDSIMYDFWNSTILNTTNWTETDPDGALSYSASYLEIANPHAVAAKSLFTDKMQSKLSISSGIASAQAYIFHSTPSSAEAQGGMYMYVDANNYAAIVTNGSAAGDQMKFIIVKGGSEVYSLSPGFPPYYDYKITYNLSTHAIDFFIWDAGTVWYSPDGPQTQDIGATVYFVASSSDSSTKTGADIIYLDNTFLTNTDYATQYPVISQDLFNTVAYYHKIDNCLMQAKRGYILSGGYYCVVRDSYINQNTILYMGNNAGEPITGSFVNMEYNSIENVVIDMDTLNTGTSIPVILAQSNYCTFVGCKIFSNVNGQSWSLSSSTTSVFNACVLTFQQLAISVNIVNCELKNNGYSPATYFITLSSGRFSGNRITCKDKADDIMLIDGSSCLIQNNIFDTGKKVYIHNASVTIKGVLFENNNWFGPYVAAAIDLQIGTATDTIVMGNAIRCNTGGGSTPTITDGGTSSTVQHNELING